MEFDENNALFELEKEIEAISLNEIKLQTLSIDCKKIGNFDQEDDGIASYEIPDEK